MATPVFGIWVYLFKLTITLWHSDGKNIFYLSFFLHIYFHKYYYTIHFFTSLNAQGHQFYWPECRAFQAIKKHWPERRWPEPHWPERRIPVQCWASYRATWCSCPMRGWLYNWARDRSATTLGLSETDAINCHCTWLWPDCTIYTGYELN
jgi:hypothetical protein